METVTDNNSSVAAVTVDMVDCFSCTSSQHTSAEPIITGRWSAAVACCTYSQIPREKHTDSSKTDLGTDTWNEL